MRVNKSLVAGVMALLPVLAAADDAAMRRRVTERQNGDIVRFKEVVPLRPSADSKIPVVSAGLYILDDGTSSVAVELRSKPVGAYDRTIFIHVDPLARTYTAFDADDVPAGVEIAAELRERNAELRRKEPSFGDLGFGGGGRRLKSDAGDWWDEPPPVCGEPEIETCDEHCSGGMTIETIVTDPVFIPLNHTFNTLNWNISGATRCRWRATGYGSCNLNPNSPTTWFIDSCLGSWRPTGWGTADGTGRGWYHNYNFGNPSLRTDATNGSFISYFSGFLSYGPIFSASGEFAGLLRIFLRVQGGIDTCSF